MDWQVNFADVIQYFKKKVWTLAVSILILAFIGFGWGMASAYLKTQNEDFKEAIATNVQKIEKKSDEIDRKLAYAQQQLINMKQYAENSIYMQLNPWDYCQGLVTWVVGLETPELGDEIINKQKLAYFTKECESYMIQAISDTKALKDADFMLDSQYYHEVCKITTDPTTGLINLSVLSYQENFPNSFFDYIFSYVLQKTAQNTEFRIEKTNLNIVSFMDLNMGTRQQSYYESIQNIENDVIQMKLEKEQVEEQMLAANSNQTLLVVKSGIKYAAVGGFLGGFISVFIMLMAYFISDVVRSKNDFLLKHNYKVIDVWKID